MTCLRVIPDARTVQPTTTIQPPGRSRPPPLKVDAKQPSLEFAVVSYDVFRDTPNTSLVQTKPSRYTQTYARSKVPVVLKRMESYRIASVGELQPRRSLLTATQRPNLDVLADKPKEKRKYQPKYETKYYSKYQPNYQWKYHQPKYHWKYHPKDESKIELNCDPKCHPKAESQRKGRHSWWRGFGKGNFARVLVNFFQLLFGTSKSTRYNGKNGCVDVSMSMCTLMKKNENLRVAYMNNVLKARKLEVENAEYRKVLHKAMKRQLSNPLACI